MLQLDSSRFFDVKTNQTFWNKSALPVQLSMAHPSSTLTVLKPSGKFERKFLLVDCYLIQWQSIDKRKWLNANNVYLSLVQNSELGDGIELSQGGKSCQLYGALEPLVTGLKRFCIQSNFTRHFKLLKKIGSGRFGQVFLCQHRHEPVQYAVKCFHKNLYKTNEDHESLLKEVQVMRRLCSEYILQLYEVFEGEDHIYIISELFQGGDLNHFLQKHHPVPEINCAKLTYRLLRATAYMHERGIFHRDIKPDNVLLRCEDELESACLADLGLADFYSASGHYLYTRCGTPGFVAPELLQDKHYDYKIDVFSIGVILYYMITGHHAFDGEDYDDVVCKNYVGKVDFEHVHMSEVGLQFLKHLLAPKPKERPTAAEALNHAWFAQEHVVKPKVIQFSPFAAKPARFLKPGQLQASRGMPVVAQSPASNSPHSSSGESPKLSPIFSPRPSRVIKKSQFLLKYENVKA